MSNTFFASEGSKGEDMHYYGPGPDVHYRRYGRSYVIFLKKETSTNQQILCIQRQTSLTGNDLCGVSWGAWENRLDKVSNNVKIITRRNGTTSELVHAISQINPHIHLQVIPAPRLHQHVSAISQIRVVGFDYWERASAANKEIQRDGNNTIGWLSVAQFSA